MELPDDVAQKLLEHLQGLPEIQLWLGVAKAVQEHNDKARPKPVPVETENTTAVEKG